MIADDIRFDDSRQNLRALLGEEWPRMRAYAAMVGNSKQDADRIVEEAVSRLGAPDLQVLSRERTPSAMVEILRAIPEVVKQMPGRRTDKGVGIPDALEALSTEDRQALALRSLMTMDRSAIADIMGETPQQVAERSARASRRIRETALSHNG
jgi:DNA-directed RNA polymerase specialized sigma24 family protein